MLRVATLVSVIALAACADQGDEGMYVLNNTAITDMGCALSGDPGQAFLSHGTIHAMSPLAYKMTPLIQSRIVADETVDPIQKTIQLRGADITLTLKAVSIERDGAYTVTQPETTLAQFSTLFSGALSPGGSVNVFVDAIPPAQLRNVLAMSGATDADTLNAEVLVSLTIKGDINGSNVVSSPFLYPVSVCTRCITVNNGACPMTITSPREGNACNPFQDGIVDCCVDLENNLVCPGPTAGLL